MMIACTWAGAPTGAIASPSGSSVAWWVLSLWPLWASCSRTCVLESGWASDTSEEPLETLTLAVVPAGGGVRALGAEPATGCTACGWTWNFGCGAAVVVELDVLEDDEDVEL